MNKTTFLAIPSEIDSDNTQRSSIGGNAILPSDLEVPPCRNCNSELLLFLQLDIDKKWSLPFITGSHLVLFMCPQCNEIPSFNELPTDPLPEEFWNETEGHFFAALTKPSNDEVVRTAEPILEPKRLNFEPLEEDEAEQSSDAIRIAGSPVWLQDPQQFVCSCGCEMALLMQIPENYGFAKQSDAPEQPDSFSTDDYCLFLGNETYIFACPEQCHPRSVWIAVQG